MSFERQPVNQKYTYPSEMCMFVVGSDVTVPLLTEREPDGGKNLRT